MHKAGPAPSGDYSKGGKTVEGSREKKPLPDVIYLLASGRSRKLTRQVISPVYRLTSPRFFWEHAVGREFGER